MKKTAAIPAIALMLVTGCSAEAAEPAPRSASAPATAKPSAETAARGSEEQTCVKLLGTGGKGPLYTAIYSVIIGDGVSGLRGTAESAAALGDTVRGIALDAPQDMVESLEGLASPMESALLSENQDSPSSFTLEAWKGHVAALLTRCAPYEGSAGGTASPAAPAPATADEVSAAYPGYPRIVNASTLDYRIAAWFGGRLVDGQVVALAPGLYAPYDPGVPDLSSYYDAGMSAGDSAVKQTVFPGSGAAASWSGVLPGSQEPQY